VECVLHYYYAKVAAKDITSIAVQKSVLNATKCVQHALVGRHIVMNAPLATIWTSQDAAFVHVVAANAPQAQIVLNALRPQGYMMRRMGIA